MTVNVTPRMQLIDVKTGQLTRDGYLLLASLNDAISDATSDFVRLDATQTLTNKTVDGDANTFTDIPTSALKTKTGTGGRVVTATAAGTKFALVTWDANGNVADSLVTTDINGKVAAKNFTSLAGTVTVAPFVYASGANLTTAAAGAVEYDGSCLYFTAVALSRGIVPAVQFSVLASDFTGTDVNTAQPVFSATQDTITLAALTTYEFEAEYFITRAAGVNSHTTAVLFGGTATFTSIGYLAQVTNPTGNALANVQQIWGAAATAVVLTAANTVATENLLIKLKGRIRVNGGGTLIPQFIYSAAPGGVPTIKTDSAFRIWPVGSNTVASVGQWA